MTSRHMTLHPTYFAFFSLSERIGYCLARARQQLNNCGNEQEFPVLVTCFIGLLNFARPSNVPAFVLYSYMYSTQT